MLVLKLHAHRTNCNSLYSPFYVGFQETQVLRPVVSSSNSWSACQAPSPFYVLGRCQGREQVETPAQGALRLVRGDRRGPQEV